MSAPLVTVITPCYNQARFVRQAVQSCLEQDYRPLQVIVIDDGSTDDPRGALEGLGGEPVEIISQENRGLPAARNRGFEAAQGEFIKFLDADDWLAPTLLRRQVEVLRSDPSLGFVYCDFHRTDETGAPLDERAIRERPRRLEGDLLPTLLAGGFFPPHTVMVPRRVLERVGLFDPELASNEDYELWMRIAASGYRATFIDERLVYYRQHGNNMSGNRSRMDATRRAALHKIMRRFPGRTAAALVELGAEIDQLHGARELALKQRAEQMEWSAQIERNNAALQAAATAREKYLTGLEGNALFRLLAALGIFPRRTESK